MINAQRDLIQDIYHKWLTIALETKPINRDRATEVINQTYQLINKKAPQIIFCNDIIDLIFQIWFFNDSETYMIKGVSKSIQNKLSLGTPQLEKEISQNISNALSKLWNIIEPIDSKLYNLLRKECISSLREETKLSQAIENNWISSFSLIYECLYRDFQISVLNLPYDPWIWEIYQSLAQECFCFCPFKKVCFILERFSTNIFSELDKHSSDFQLQFDND
ncbi:hypothetical protein [Hyella patelloides]|nr:hypothetical protein [Hyella patelloides]